MTLRELYINELNELYDVEQQLLLELPLMSAGATSARLRDAFDMHYRQTQAHLARLEQLFVQLEERPRVQQSHGLRGIIEDARDRNAPIQRGEILDAALIALGRRIEHYEIATYESAGAYAAAVMDAQGLDLLRRTLHDETDMSRRLSAFAEGRDEEPEPVAALLPPPLPRPFAATP